MYVPARPHPVGSRSSYDARGGCGKCPGLLGSSFAHMRHPHARSRSAGRARTKFRQQNSAHRVSVPQASAGYRYACGPDSRALQPHTPVPACTHWQRASQQRLRTTCERWYAHRPVSECFPPKRGNEGTDWLAPYPREEDLSAGLTQIE